MPGLLKQVWPLRPFVARKLEVCNDVELNPGPKNSTAASPKKSTVAKKQEMSNGAQTKNEQGDSREMMPAHDVPRVKKLGKAGFWIT